MVDPYNDNDKNNFLRWLQINHDYVINYLRLIKANIDMLSLSPRACMMLKMEGLYLIADVFPLSAVQLAAYDLSDEKIAKEISSHCFYYLKDIRNELVDYVFKMKQEPGNATTASEIEINPEVLLSEEAFKEDFLNYLVDHDIPIERFDLSVRTYNVLKRSKVNYLSEAVELYPDGFAKLRNMGEKSINEIKKQIEEQATHFTVNKNNPVIPNSEKVEPKVEEYIPQSIYDLLYMPKFRDKVFKYFDFIELKISDFNFSGRTKNCLMMANISSFTDLLRFYPTYSGKIRHLAGKSIDEIEKTVEEILEKHSHSVLEFVQDENNFSFDNDLVCKRILDQYEKYKPFYGISFDEFRQNLPEIINDTSLKKCIGLLISENKIEYVDYRCYKVYPSFYDAVKVRADDTENNKFALLLKLWSGMTLEQIANEIGITREAVRQKTGKAITELTSITRFFTEDYYAYLYANYAIDEKTWVNDIGVSEITYRYLKKRYYSDNSKKKSMEIALDDDNVSVSLKYKIIDAINKNKVVIDGIMFTPKRGVIEDYIIYKYCQDEIAFDDFCDLYNRILQTNGVPEDPEIYFTEELRRSRNNRLSESHKVLWKTGMRFRYYDVDGKDYQELLDTIGIYSYHNTGLSTLYWINNYPDIMEKYDIRDQYELHNLLKKIIPEGSINGIHFDRMPGITFGNFDRDQMVYELMCRYSPISSEELAEVFYNEYGYDKGSCQANYFNCIRQYFHNGVYSVNFKSIPADRVVTFINALNEDLYFDDEVRNIYFSLYPDAEPDEINPRSMQEIGFTTYARYYLKNKWPSLSEFFRNLLSKDELFNCSAYNKRYGYIQLYTETLRNLRASFDLFILDDGTALSIDRLAKASVSKQDIRDYCDAVDQYAGDSSFFTLRSLAKAGFEASLENLGFDDSFYERILEICGRFNSSHCENVMVFAKGEGTTNFTKKDFILSVVSKFRSITIDDLVDYIADEYGIRFKEKHRLTGLFANTDIYYDQIMDTVYANKEAYYDELG